MKRRIIPLVLALLTLTLSACDSPAAPDGATLEGSYALSTVNGLALPLDRSWTDPSGRHTERELLSGSLSLRSDGVYVEEWTYRTLDADPVTLRFTGEYERTAPDAALLHPEAPHESRVRLTATGLEMVANYPESGTMAYRRTR